MPHPVLELRPAPSSSHSQHGNTGTMDGRAAETMSAANAALNRRTVRKLDTVLLPFLALLFLFNSLDRSNIGNAETADFTKDVGLQPDDLNTAVAVFFAFFVLLQPVGAALGRKFGMARYVPACMAVWGLCTALHVWVRSRWQLIGLRVVIGVLEAGFYPTTVSYLSLFYTRYEFARRLGIFYGQYAVAGALGGLLAYVVFSHFPSDTAIEVGGWKSWQILFLLEGGATIMIAVVGFFWLPHNAQTAWFLRQDERNWAEERIRLDREQQPSEPEAGAPQEREGDYENPSEEETEGLLQNTTPLHYSPALNHNRAATDDRGLTKADVLEAVLDWKLWYLLSCNILSAIPVTAFTVFLPLVLKSLAPDPATANLLTAPPYLIGAALLYTFTSWSDRSRRRLRPILWSLVLVVVGLVGAAALAALPTSGAVARYAALCLLLGGTFSASPLTVAWFSDNVPAAGKRAVVLGVNGWGNAAGIVAALLFRPEHAPAYALPCAVTAGLVAGAFGGYAVFGGMLRRENERRERVVRGWTAEEVEVERRLGRGPVVESKGRIVGLVSAVAGGKWAGWVEELMRTGEGRRGDERLTFRYSF